MEKTPRYTQKERNMVLGYAAQHKDIIENKRTDAESNRKKDEVWRQIAKEFNARVYHQRSAKQLRQLYKNMKLLLKKDLCGEDKGNRTFMDLLNTISQQESVAQYISELSPGGFSASGRLQKYEDEYDDMKMPSVGSYGHDMDTDVIVIKSEELSDNEHSRTMEDMEDDDDSLGPKDIPEVCLEEEDEELFTDSRPNSNSNHPSQQNNNQSLSQDHKPEVTIQNLGNIRVTNLANLSKALNSNNNGVLSISNSNSNTNNNNNNSSNSNSNNNHSGNGNNANLRQTSAEQAQQQMLLGGLGLSAVNPVNAVVQRAQQNSRAMSPQMPTLQRANTLNSNSNNSGNSSTNAVTQLLMNFSNGTNYGAKLNGVQISSHHGNNNSNSNNSSNPHNSYIKNYAFNSSSSHNNNNNNNNTSNHNNNNNNNNGDVLMFLEIEEKKRKIDLLNAQTEYWKTLTKKLETNSSSHFGAPTCACHFSNPLNGVATNSNGSTS